MRLDNEPELSGLNCNSERNPRSLLERSGNPVLSGAAGSSILNLNLKNVLYKRCIETLMGRAERAETRKRLLNVIGCTRCMR